MGRRKKAASIKLRIVQSNVGAPLWADKELLGLYSTPRTERAMIECISIRESIGRQLGGYHCANVRMILYKNHSPKRYYKDEQWEGIKRLLVKYSGWIEDNCRTNSSIHHLLG